MQLADTGSYAPWSGVLLECLGDTMQHIADGFLNVQAGDIIEIICIVEEIPPNSSNSATRLGLLPGIPIQIVGHAALLPPLETGATPFRSFLRGEPFEGLHVRLRDVYVTALLDSSQRTFRFADSAGTELATANLSGNPLMPLPPIGTHISILQGIPTVVTGSEPTYGKFRIAPVYPDDIVVSPSGVENLPGVDVPRDFALFQNFPNPFNPTTQIEFSIPVSSHAVLTVFNMLGQKVETLFEDELPIGRYRVPWDSRGLSSGIYIYKLQAGTFVRSRKMIVLR
jgi:hypothetical protein